MNAQYDVGDRPGVRDAVSPPRTPVSIADARGRGEVLVAQTDEVLLDAVGRARRLADDQPEPFRSLAFSALLQHFLQASEGSGFARAAGPPTPKLPPETDMQIAEFLAQRRVDSHPDRVVAIAYYHLHRFDGDGVTTKDLVEGYAKSRAKRPQNYPDVIASCMRKGYLVEGARRDGNKSWVITRMGEAHVEQDM